MTKRNAFTLVEMLVAMALTLFIMVIITQAFTAGLETFRQMKGIGDLQQQLRLAAQRVQADLKLEHFDGNRHLGDPAFPAQGKVRYGFFRIVQGSALSGAVGAPYVFEGFDLDTTNPTQPESPPSMRATDHMLHFSNNLRGDRPQHFYTTTVPTGAPYPNPTPGPPYTDDPKPFDPLSPYFQVTNYFNQPIDATYQQAGTYSSQWAEIAYYLVLTGWTADPDNANANQGTPLFALYRTELVVVPRADPVQNLLAATQNSGYSTISTRPDNTIAANAVFTLFNAPEDLAAAPTQDPNFPADPKAILFKRGFPQTQPTAPVPGSALVLKNVVSFQVQISNGGEPFHDVPGPATSGPPLYIFDTAMQGNTPTRLSGIQVTLRIWDPESGATRQVTILQDM